MNIKKMRELKEGDTIIFLEKKKGKTSIECYPIKYYDKENDVVYTKEGNDLPVESYYKDIEKIITPNFFTDKPIKMTEEEIKNTFKPGDIILFKNDIHGAEGYNIKEIDFDKKVFKFDFDFNLPFDEFFIKFNENMILKESENKNEFTKEKEVKLIDTTLYSEDINSYVTNHLLNDVSKAEITKKIPHEHGISSGRFKIEVTWLEGEGDQ